MLAAVHGAPRTNVVLFLIDDLDGPWLPGSRYYHTPNIDSRAAEGRFTAYASCAVCTPTRASVMTGSPARNMTQWLPAGVAEAGCVKGGSYGGCRWRKSPLPSLQEEVRTLHVGKWHPEVRRFRFLPSTTSM